MGSAMFPGEGEGPSQTFKVVYWIITVICAIIWIPEYGWFWGIIRAIFWYVIFIYHLIIKIF
jgi:hypothetical protein